MVLILHANFILNQYRAIDEYNWIYSAFQVPTNIAVHLFVIISSWFMVGKTKINFKRMAMIYGVMWFYNVINMSIGLGTKILEQNTQNYLYLFLPFLSNYYYYVTNFIILMFLAPFINIVLMKISKKQFALLAWFFIFLVPVWKGISNVVYYATDAKVSLFVLSGDGFTILTFIGLYIVTAYLKTHVNYQKIKAIWFLLVYVLVSGIFIVISFYSLPIYARFRQYNNPYLWVTAFSLFLFFVNLKPIKVNEHIGKIIKLLASCSLAVYIMHFNLFQNILRYRLYEFFNQNLNNIFGSWLALVFVLIFSCYLTEIIRKAIMYFINPSAKLFFEKINFNFIKPLN